MHPLKPNEIEVGYSVDRRKLIENFLHVAQSMNAVEDFNIARKTLTRQKFVLDAFEEVYWNNIDRFTLEADWLPGSNRFAQGASLINGLSSGSYTLDWSCNLIRNDKFATAVAAYGIIVIPFVDGKLVWEGYDLLINQWHYDTAGDKALSNYYHSACGKCCIEISSGKSEIGLIAVPYSDRWLMSQMDISNLQFVARRRVR